MTDVQLFFDGDVTPVNQRNSVYLWDDFGVAGGSLGWNATGTGSLGTVNGASADHPGVVALASGSSSGDEYSMSWGDVLFNRVTTMEWVFLLPATTAERFRLGLMNSPTGTTPGEGVLVEYDTSLGDTALSLVKYIGGTRTVGTTIALTAAHWYRMNWSNSGSGAGTMVVNDLTAATNVTTNFTGLGTSGSLFFGGAMKALAAGGKSADIDWFLGSLSGMVR